MKKKLTLMSFCPRFPSWPTKEYGVFLWLNYDGERPKLDAEFWKQAEAVQERYGLSGIALNYLEREPYLIRGTWKFDD